MGFHALSSGENPHQRNRRHHIFLSEQRSGVDLHGLDRRGTELLGVERIGVLHQPAVALEHLRVVEFDLLLALRLDGEHADLDHPLADVLEQGGILTAADDVLVDRPGTIC